MKHHMNYVVSCVILAIIIVLHVENCFVKFALLSEEFVSQGLLSDP